MIIILQSEVNYLGRLHHPNLVQIIGYCLEDDKRLLVYEFISLGSLENHLFKRGPNFQPLSWNLRLKLVIGAAKGLAYLHSLEANVMFRDFKCSNILVDSDYNAKLYGYAKSHVSTRVMDTYGYDPEYMESVLSCLHEGHLTEGGDIYSFGVVLLEILTGRPCVDNNRPYNERVLVDFAKPYLTSKKSFLQIMDRGIDGQYTADIAMRAATLAKKCLARKPKDRPTANELVKVLEQLQLQELQNGSETMMLVATGNV
ncbi:putative serine/threonine-protein kinase PBL11 [Bidens hawaiensis]|uniref:putative serine/threonine-protein kinase PBL11 n=1 Tax=Bidens hawaiensis TaxID=980011 RepID=UPI004049A5C9